MCFLTIHVESDLTNCTSKLSLQFFPRWFCQDVLGSRLCGSWTRNRPQGKPHKCSVLYHQARGARIESCKGTDDRKSASDLVDSLARTGVLGGRELGDRQEEKGQDQEKEHGDDREVGPQGGDQEDEGEEAPEDEIDPNGKAVGALVTAVSTYDVQGGDQEHGETEPESAVGTVDCCAKGVAHVEFHDASDELSETTHEDGKAEDSLIRADFTFRVFPR